MDLGGGELYLDELLRRLKQDHEELEILVVTGGGGPLIAPLRARGIAVHVTGGYRVHPHAYASGRRELQLVMATWRPDVVLANTLGVFPAVDAAVELGLPTIWALHESFELEEYITLNWGPAGLAETVEARMRHALTSAHTVFEAQATLEQYARQLPQMRARHIPYGVDLAEIERYRAGHDRRALRAELDFDDDEFVILCMGVFQERKAQAALVLAFYEVAELFPRAHLVLVGYLPSDYGKSVERIVDGLGLRSRVSVVPIQPDSYRWYTVADVLVSASDIESLPRSILEAKAFGLPTLATDVFGLPEIITDGVNGWLCRPSSGNALTAGLFRVLSTSPARIAAMREACTAEAPRYDGAGYGTAYFTFATELAETNRWGTPREETPAHG
jgi:D-inositol-3-phosphate glycosyltransferase